MTLAMVLFVGGVVGWLADRVMLVDGRNLTYLHTVAGAMGGVMGGWLMLSMAGEGGLLGEYFSAPALLGSLLGAALLLCIVNLIRRRGLP